MTGGLDVGNAYVDIDAKFDKLEQGIGKQIEGLTSKFGKAFTGVFAGAGALLAGSEVLGFFRSSIDEAREAAKVSRLTEQVILSTGGAAKISAAQVDALATALSNKSGIDDEVIASGANVLLTFTNVKNELGAGNNIFDQATESALNMSAALGQDTQSSVTQLGKALNDPIKGITALSRVGVAFTDQQKKQIETLVASGRTMEAQKIILGELNTEFGGAAEAAADPMAKLGVMWGNFQEQVGTRILPLVERAGTWIGDRLPVALSVLSDWWDKASAAMQPFVDGFSTLIESVFGGGGIERLLSAFGGGGIAGLFTEALSGDDGVISSAWPQLQQTLQGIMSRVWAWVVETAPRLLDAWVAWQQTLFGWVAEALPPLLEQLGMWLGGALGWFVDVGIPALWGKAQELVAVMSEWAGRAVPPLLSKLGELLARLGTWIVSTALPHLWEKLKTWGDAFWRWFDEVWPPFQTQLGVLIGQFGTWFTGTALPWLSDHLRQWAAAFVDWIREAVPALLGRLGELLAALGTWLVGTALPWLLTHLAEWAAAFVSWVIEAVPPLVGKLGELLASIGTWIVGTALPWLIQSLVNWAAAFVGWLIQAAFDLPYNLAQFISGLISWISDTALPWIRTKLAEWVTAFVSWATDAATSLPEALANIGTKILDFIIGLPAKITQAAAGMFDGITKAFIAAVNWLLTTWNGLTLSLPSIDTHIPGVGVVGGFTLDTPNLPLIPMAKGGSGTVTGPTLFLAGEAGDEDFSFRPRSGDDPGGSAGRPLIVQLVASGKVIAEVVEPHLRVVGGVSR